MVQFQACICNATCWWACRGVVVSLHFCIFSICHLGVKSGGPRAPKGHAMDQPAQNEDAPVKAVILRLGSDLLHGIVNSEGSIEWEWNRVAATLKLGTDKPYLVLKRGLENFQAEFAAFQVPWSQFHYRGKESGKDCGHHTFESRAMVLMLCLMSLRRTCSPESKCKALEMLTGLLRSSFQKPLY